MRLFISAALILFMISVQVQADVITLFCVPGLYGLLGIERGDTYTINEAKRQVTLVEANGSIVDGFLNLNVTEALITFELQSFTENLFTIDRVSGQMTVTFQEKTGPETHELKCERARPKF